MKQKITMPPETLVSIFNRLFQPGATVNWRNIAHENVAHREYTVKSPAFVSNGGTPVAFLVERSGYVSIEPEHVDYADELSEGAAA